MKIHPCINFNGLVCGTQIGFIPATAADDAGNYYKGYTCTDTSRCAKWDIIAGTYLKTNIAGYVKIQGLRYLMNQMEVKRRIYNIDSTENDHKKNKFVIQCILCGLEPYLMLFHDLILFLTDG